MKASVGVSAVAHAGLIMWGLFAFPHAEALHTEQPPALPVDLVSIEDVTRLSAGEKTAEEKKPPAVRKIEAPQKAEEQPREAAKPEAKPEPRPEPTPEPKPEPTPAAEPAPAPRPEPSREAAPQPEPQPRAEPEQPRLLANAPLPERRPRTIPRPQPAQPSQAAPDRPKAEPFDPDKIAALLDKTPDPSGGATDNPNVDDRPALGTNEGTADTLSLSDIDALRQQISRCYNPPLAVLEARGLTVRLNMALSEDGSIQTGPRLLNSSGDPLFGLAAEAAMRAVTGCQPYTLPPEKYHLWRNITMNFDPRDMLR